MKQKPDYIFNLMGLRCPETLMIIRKKMRNIKKNKLILFISDDTTIINDIEYFCNFMNHILITKTINSGLFKFLLRKG